MKLTKEKQRQLAVECAQGRRSCPGCNWQHLCQEARRKKAMELRAEYDAALPEWKRHYYGLEA